MKHQSLILLGLVPSLLLPSLALGQGGEPFPGLTLFQPLASTTTYLVDNSGATVHSWPGTNTPGNSVYLLDNDHRLRTVRVAGSVGGSGGGVQELDWDGTVLWNFTYSSPDYLGHHDIELLPNGNILMIAWDYISRPQAVAAGRNPAYLQGQTFAPDHIIEIEPSGTTGGTIVWEWHIMDHVIQDFDSSRANYGVVADHPELIDLNFPPVVAVQGDWNHVNSIHYNAELDQILLSSHNQHELWIIDHSTTTAEAAGHTGGNSGRGGDLLYRYGNPQAYGAGTAADQKLFGQHDAQWIETGSPGAGNIITFNNGNGRPGGNYSSIDEITPPSDGSGGYLLTPGSAYGPAQLSWTYVAPTPTDFYASHISGVQRLPNGNTLICSGTQAWFFEVTAASQIVWEYFNTLPTPQNSHVFRARRYLQCSDPVTYCSTSPNSNGAGALVDWSGSSSLTANDLVLSVDGAASSKPGLFFFGPLQAQVPLGDGVRCVAGGLSRMPVVWTDATGSTSHALNFTGASLAAFAAGDTLNFQFWFRDPQAGGAGSNLSDALEVQLCN